MYFYHYKGVSFTALDTVIHYSGFLSSQVFYSAEFKLLDLYTSRWQHSNSVFVKYLNINSSMASEQNDWNSNR